MRPRSLTPLIALGVLALGVLTLGSACDERAPEPTPPDVGRYTTEGSAVFDGHGRQLLLRGVNVPTLDATEAEFRRIADWGATVVRQLYFWADVEPVEGEIDHLFIERIADQVALAKEQGLLVLLDMHQHTFGVGFLWGMPYWACDESYYESCDDPCDYFDVEVQACFEQFWRSEALTQQYIDHLVLLAERFADEPAVIGFDVMNEPFCAHENMNGCGVVLGDFYARAAEAILAVAPHKLIFFEPNYMAYLGLPTEVTAPTYPNAVYAPHYYLMSIHDGGDYDLNPEPILGALAMRQSEADAFGTPMFMGEFGGMAQVAGFDQFIEDHMHAFDHHLAGYAYWLYARGDGFHLLDPEGREKPFVDVFVRPYPQRTPGTLTSLAYDRATRVMHLRFTGDASLDASGLLYVPDRHYPDGFSLTGCDAPDCTWEHDPTRQRSAFWITADGDYELTLSPPEP
ncbi:MAG: cellulase family glycosylhydrolase [bacterium]